VTWAGLAFGHRRWKEGGRGEEEGGEEEEELESLPWRSIVGEWEGRKREGGRERERGAGEGHVEDTKDPSAARKEKRIWARGREGGR